MNIFLPYPSDIAKSVQSLDSVRLNKQILEAKVLLDGALAYAKGEVENGYFKHPVAQFYKDNPQFLAWYGYECCLEYKYRFDKEHQLETYFRDNQIWKVRPDEKGFTPPKFTPYYMELPKSDPNNIRTTNETYVRKLFKAKLLKKWLTGKKAPNWHKRAEPIFWACYISLSQEYKDNYWGSIKILKENIIDKGK